MHKKIASSVVFLGFLVLVQHSSGQDDVYVSSLWNYTHFTSDCSSKTKETSQTLACEDIRVCRYAKASLAMGGWPAVCGWVDNVVPKVCCGYPLILGGALMRKIEEEMEKHSHCGRAVFAYRESPTRIEYERIVDQLTTDFPDIDGSDPSIFDPPLEVTNSDGGGGGALGVSDVGHVFAKQFEFPWMVSIQANGKHFCGGSLIDRTHVLTAAHCFDERRGTLEPSNVVVLTGDVILGNGHQINVTKILLHNKYIPGQNYHDIAIVTLEKEVHPDLHPVCLPSRDLSIKNFVGEYTTLLGWGHTSYGGRGTSELQSIPEIPVVSNQECRRAYREVSQSQLPRGLTNDFICAGLEEGGLDACQGDSGGPLMYEHTDYDYPVGIPTQRWVQIGVVSFGFKCGEPGFPGVYTRVSSYMYWISKNMKDYAFQTGIKYLC